MQNFISKGLPSFKQKLALPPVVLLVACLTFLPSWSSQELMGATQGDDETLKISGSPTRTWSSANGQFQQEGQLIEIIGSQVRLETSDGRRLTVAIEKLSPRDQQFIATEKTRIDKASNPFMEETPATSAPRTEASTANSSEGLISQPILDYQPELGALQLIQLDSEREIDFTAPRWQPSSPPKTKEFQIPGFTVHSRVTASSANHDNTRFLLALHEPFGVNLNTPPRQSSSRTLDRGANRQSRSGGTKDWIELYDLQNHRSVGRWPFPYENTIVTSIDVTGQFLLAVDNVFNSEPRVKIFQLEDGEFKIITSWLAETGKRIREAANRADFLAENHAVVSYNDKLTVWSLNPLKLMYSASKDPSPIRIANDRRHALVTYQNRAYEIDLLAGSCTGIANAGQQAKSGGAISLDGSREAQLVGREMVIQNQQGEQLDKFFVPIFTHNSQLTWMDADTLKIDSQHQSFYVDVNKRVVFLQVTKFPSNFASGMNQTGDGWTTQKNNSGGSFTITVSWNETESGNQSNRSLSVEEYRKKLPSDPESLLILKAGDKVRLVVDLQATPELNQQIRDQFTRMLGERGVVIDDQAKDMVRVVSARRQEEIEYTRHGAFMIGSGQVEKVNVSIVDQSVEMSRDNQVVFRQGSSSGPGFTLFIKEGETAQQAADRASGNPESFWKQFSFPEKIAAHPGGMPWSTTHQKQ